MGTQFKRFKNRRTATVMITVLCMIFSLVPKLNSYASGWGSDSYGWYYHDGSSYYYSRWAEIDGYWYYFTSEGYMDYSEYRDGCWLEASGVWNTAYANGMWKVNSTGWWFEDNGWYPADQWLWVDGECYHFATSGYLEYECYRDGCWLTKSGAWDKGAGTAHWASDSAGWWFEDNGWYPKNQGLWIDGVYYWFGEDGYWDEAETEKKRESGNDGRKDPSGGGGASNQGGKEDNTPTITYGEYSYSVIPMLPPFNDYFYVKTENPDPDSFGFVDESTVYAPEGTGSIHPETSYFCDVKYENSDTLRVKGGYIFVGSHVDGGKLRFINRKVTGTTPVYNITTGETTYRKNYEDEQTDTYIDIGTVVDEADYLIQTYSGSATDFFGKLSNIQSGFGSICLYSGASIRGELYKSTDAPYYGLSNSPHIDQGLYIQKPYGRKGSKPLLVSSLYPFRYDSLGFPGMMGVIAKRLDPSATYKQNSSSHWMIDVTSGGTTKSYGGQGYGGGQPINQENVNYWFKFDKSSDDAYANADLAGLNAQLKYYGSLSIPDDIPTEDRLTAAIVRKTVGEGKYVKIIGITSVFGSGGEAYTYLYDNGATSEGVSYNINVGVFRNAWYDGRYFNRFETFESGVKFGENSKRDTVTNTGTASIVIKDAVLKVPTDKAYKYNYTDMSKVSNYDVETGKWKGYMYYNYDAESGNWIASVYKSIKYNGALCDDQDFIDACTFTPEEVAEMNIDANTDKAPDEFLIYDKKSAPGTPGTYTPKEGE